MNVARNVASVLGRIEHAEIRNKQAYRSVVTRELTAGQARDMVAALEAVVTRIVEIPETPSPQRVFSLVLVLGTRFERAAGAGLRTGTEFAAADLRAGLTA
jgi:hypothetical protein